jgi:DNA polymerase-3 subunit epsilon
MREIILDTETTGLDPAAGDRLVEIACLELVNHLPTGARFHRYLNPDRAVSAEAFRVHGLSDTFLAAQPRFAEVAEELLAFLGDARLVIHNADFDMGFLNAELGRLGHPRLGPERALDTLQMARRRFPGAQASLDALCKRFGIDNSGRSLHGAVLDAELLSEVYLELIGGRQATMELGQSAASVAAGRQRPVRPARPHAASTEELAAHEGLVQSLRDPVWRQ